MSFLSVRWETTAGLAICIEGRTSAHLAQESIYEMPRRILIADDSPLARKTLQDLLQTHGWEVCGQAENGVDAVTMATELNPDVVILDLAMPSMDGLTAARQISESLPTIPIVMHTLHDLPQLELKAKKNGVRCIVPKSESGCIISVLEELTSAGSAQGVAEMEPATTKPAHVPATENTLRETQAAESESQAESPDDIAKAS
jgi:DNA-binding NarL/FixJ family response regulator